MAVQFPTNLDDFTNPATSDTLDSPSHAGQHTDANDAIEALEAKVGKNSSAVTTSHDYKLSGVTGTDKAVSKTGTEVLTNKTLTSPVLTTPVLNTSFSGTAKATGAEINTGTEDAKIVTPKAIKDSIIFNAPEGFLLNGKIVPSVTSNNLTVAIKGLDGNNPSATNPVYIRIGDTIHSITSALSVPAAAGTNWCNAGSSELATKEIDYFVYLGYNATDGVVIGFARIPYVTEYSQFSTTSTDEKYCAISTITNAAAGDDYVVIGRFAATLSAGAGYTWSVPTFDSKNLIQRPIFETRVLSWQPTFSASGSMTYTSVSIPSIGYKVAGSSFQYAVVARGTTGGSASNQLKFTIPFIVDSSSNYQTVVGYCRDGGGTYVLGYSSVSNNNTVSVSKYDNSNFGLGTDRELYSNGVLFLY